MITQKHEEESCLCFNTNGCIEYKAKKEVIDDYEIEWKKGNPLSPNEMRQRHLSTFAKSKSNIIADKQNPQNDITLCSICNCMTKTSMDGYCMKCASDKQFT